MAFPAPAGLYRQKRRPCGAALSGKPPLQGGFLFEIPPAPPALRGAF